MGRRRTHRHHHPPTVLELIERAEAAERALDFHSQRDRELKTTLSMISDRLDEHSYDELSSLIEDAPLDQWGELYKSRLEQAEQAVARVRAEIESAREAGTKIASRECNGSNASIRDHSRADGYLQVVHYVTRALDGDGRG